MRDIVPNSNNEGAVGTNDKRWAEGHFQSLKVSGSSITAVPDLSSQNISLLINDAGYITISGVTKQNAGLGNVDNVQQIPMSYLDTDILLAANSNSKVASQRAVKNYVDNLVKAQYPVILMVKNISVLTTGAPNDIATISVPAILTRYRTMGNTATTQTALTVFVESSSGSLSAAQFQIFDLASGGGTALTNAASGGTSANTITGTTVPANAWSNRSTLFVRQLTNSGNAGTVSFYIVLYPLV